MLWRQRQSGQLSNEGQSAFALITSALNIQILELEVRWSVLESIHRVEGARSMGMGTMEDHHLDSHWKDILERVSEH